MAQISSSSALRAYTYRLTSAKPHQLSQVASQVSGLIWNCKDILSLPVDIKQKDPEASNTVQRFKTLLNTLLQDRSVEGRWSAVVLVKSTIEAGGVEVLAKSNAWVRSLLAILKKKPDPPSTRCLTILTLTRIFMLTWDHSNLVREITTPALTAFVPTCISTIEGTCSVRELQVVLDAFSVLLPKHPTIFRTYETRLRTVLQSLLSANSSDVRPCSQKQQTAARKILVLSHACVPKQGAKDKWEETLRATVLATHATCDRVFRAIIEDWQSSADVESTVSQHLRYNGDVESESEDTSGLKPWKGIFAGSERIKSLLRLIESHLVTATAAAITVRLGLVVDLFSRLLSIGVPQHEHGSQLSFSSQIPRDERDALLASLPGIRAAALRLDTVILHRFGCGAFPFLRDMLDQVVSIFQADVSNVEVRSAVYGVLDRTFELAGPSMLKHEIAMLDPILRRCCEDLVDINHHEIRHTHDTGSSNGIAQQLGLNEAKRSLVQTRDASNAENEKIAYKLLCTVLRRLDSKTISPRIRAQMDRIAVLTLNRDALVASVMNPPRKQGDRRPQESLLPVLARRFGPSSEVEAILRPRMPPILSFAPVKSTFDLQDDSEEDDEAQTEQNGNGSASNGEFEESQPMENLPLAESVYTTTAHDDSQEFGTIKRRASGDTDGTIPMKRPRLEFANDDSTSSNTTRMTSVAAAQSTTHWAAEPSQVPAQKNGTSNSHDGSKEQSVNVTAGIGRTGAASDEDDSDFEMPPLTMDPDTEDEA